jgi:hypothetical protein
MVTLTLLVSKLQLENSLTAFLALLENVSREAPSREGDRASR